MSFWVALERACFLRASLRSSLSGPVVLRRCRAFRAAVLLSRAVCDCVERRVGALVLSPG